MKNVIHIGSIIDTLDGYIIITSINEAGLAWADEYIVDGDDEAKKTDTVLKLTAQDIARRMRELDGKNHTVIMERG